MNAVNPNPMSSHQRVQRIVRRRRLLRRVRLGVLVFLGLVAAGVAGFGIDEGVVYGRHLWSSLHPRVTTPPTNSAPVGPTTTYSGPPACTGTQLVASLSHWQVVGSSLYEIVVLDDTSPTPCTLSGFAGLSVVAPDGGTVSSPVHDDPSLGTSGGASSSPIPMAAGQRAWFEVTYPVHCSQVLAPGQASSGAPGQCYQGAALGVVLASVPVASAVAQPLHFEYGTTGFTVGPFGSGNPPPSPPTS